MKTKLSQAIAMATLVGAATVNPAGLGGALLYPVYTVNNENTTLVSVTNTTDQYKAVKVRFLEGKNSAEVLDFHLYLSPKDVWSGSIVATETGAKLLSKDTSCIPGFSDGFPAEGLEFRDFEILKDSISGVVGVGVPDGADTSIARSRVGHFEVIEMGVVDPAFVLDAAAVPAASGTAGFAIKHVNGVPGNCGNITKAWEVGGVWEKTGNDSDKFSQTDGLSAPTGGLYGTAAIVNVPGGWAASYDAVAVGDPAKTVAPAANMAITAVTGAITAGLPGTAADLGKGPGAGANGPWNAAAAALGGGLWSIPQHPRPGSVYPSLDTVDVHGANVSTLAAVTGLVASEDYIAPGMPVQAAAGDAVGRVSFALNQTGIYNDYYIKQALNAETDMVVSFPTKRFHVNIKPDALVGTEYIRLRSQPFSNGWNLSKNKSCEEIAINYYDKEERVGTVTVGMVSPRPTEPKFSLCYETNILSVGARSDIIGGKDLRQQFNVDFSEGWFAVTLAGSRDTAGQSGVSQAATAAEKGAGAGLPIIGFSTILTKNGNVGGAGVLANYAQTFKNKTN
ncbi:MAG: hypothetical protein QMB92_10805 [Thiopseudomonas sp.]